MKRIGLAAAAIALVAGCGTLRSSYNAADDIDVEYMAAVEQAARRYGTQVVWIHVPRKRQTSIQ